MGQKKDLKIDEFVEITMSSRKTRKQRRIEEVLQMLADSDTLIVTKLSRLGRSTVRGDEWITALSFIFGWTGG